MAVNSLLELEGKAALVAGGGQGMGRAAAILLARAGCRVAVLDVVVERAETVAAELAQLGAESHAIAADVTESQGARDAVSGAVKAFGRLDRLVNIVGMASWGALLELDEATWDADHRLNLKQHFLVGRAAAAQMIEQGEGGSIAMVASVSGLFGAPRHGADGAAKAGLMALTKTMAEEWYPHGIRVNSVAPGSVRTPRIMAQQASGEAPSESDPDAARWVEMDDIAGALLFLSSGLAKSVTGQTLVVDSGKTALFPFSMS